VLGGVDDWVSLLIVAGSREVDVPLLEVRSEHRGGWVHPQRMHGQRRACVCHDGVVEVW